MPCQQRTVTPDVHVMFMADMSFTDDIFNSIMGTDSEIKADNCKLIYNCFVFLWFL